MQIRRAKDADLDAMWAVFQPIVAAGDSLPYDETFDREAFRLQWFSQETSYVAVVDAAVVGMYRFGPNHTGRGAHVANATYLVSTATQGRGVGRALVLHSLDQTRAAGFIAIQFNFVVSTNVRAVELYRSLGFSIVGTLPKAFRHRTLGLVDACVMFRSLQE